MAENLPGLAPHVHEGGNYAQPTATTSALPGGNPLERALSWSGRQNCASPHGGSPDLDAVYEQFEGEAPGRLGAEEQRLRKEQRFQFYEALLDA